MPGDCRTLVPNQVCTAPKPSGREEQLRPPLQQLFTDPERLDDAIQAVKGARLRTAVGVRERGEKMRGGVGKTSPSGDISIHAGVARGPSYDIALSPWTASWLLL
ncbi:hypothetical protein Vretifemale_8763 [Volvox reticuliferus]|uniref:Uncharacterized protein n=1 Tax=Volvox reticuliferus TaxID=1737510 RepID=A0A8J4CB83_9CHLO|nr:hypothetical protein Vretifemale_8763 [Volvox reticuliferus]